MQIQADAPNILVLFLIRFHTGIWSLVGALY